MSGTKRNGGNGGWEPGRSHIGNEHFKTINGRRFRLYQSGDGDSFHYEVDNTPGGTIPDVSSIEEAAEKLEESFGGNK